jgi:hypothetical protein
MKINEGRKNSDFVAVVAGNQGKEVGEKNGSLFRSFVHFPVGSDQFLSHVQTLAQQE